MEKVDSGKCFAECRYEARLSVDETADYLGVSLRTVQRWIQFDNAPAWASYLLWIHAGHLPWTDWEGWQVDNGHLFQPGFSRHGMSPGDIYALPFLYQLLAEYRRKSREFDSLIDQAAVDRCIPEWIKAKTG